MLWQKLYWVARRRSKPTVKITKHVSKWIPEPDVGWYCYDCGYLNQQEESNYCPQCGAWMHMEDEEDGCE